MATQGSKPRVIIAGGSIAGLTLALCLQKADIDFLVLERGIIAPQLGASVGMYPSGNNIMNQLGVFPELAKITYPLEYGQSFDDRGSCFASTWAYRLMMEKFGYPIAFQQRREFIEAIYRQIDDKSKVQTRKEVVSFEETGDAVTVRTADGAWYEGTILVGADGVHSTIRTLMSNSAPEERGFRTTDNGQPGFASSYKAVFAISRTDTETCPMAPGRVWHVYGKGHSSIVASGTPGHLFWFLFVKIPHVRAARAPRYSQTDIEAVIDEYRDMRMCHEFTIGEAWEARVQGDMVALEEGVVDRWSYGRVVLVGDAIHKVTINVGLGANMAIEGCVQLTNLLQPILSSVSAASTSLTTSQCDRIFQDYHSRHLPRARLIYDVSALGTRIEAQETIFHYLVSRYIMPLLSDSSKVGRLHQIIKGAPTLNFIAKDMERSINHPSPPRTWPSWVVATSTLCMAVSIGLVLALQGWGNHT